MDCRCSIVIPYHAQASTIDFLRRQLSYYYAHSTPSAVIVAVSGDDSLKGELKQFIKNLNDSRFVIFTVNESDITNKESFLKKIYDALRRVKTPYVIINGADDVIMAEAIGKGCEILANNPYIAAVKGHTTYFDCASGGLYIVNDLEIIDKCPLRRIKIAIMDRDSIFYIIRKTEDLVREFRNIVDLSIKSEIVGNSLYHIEHFLALSVASIGNVRIINSPWRVQTAHKDNHTAHTPASFIRFKLGVIDRDNYEWFQSVTNNMKFLNYKHYKFLWVCSQITNVSVTLKQIVYNLIHKKCSFVEFIRLSMYFFSNKIYVFSQKFLPKKFFSEKITINGNAKDFVKTEHYKSLKKYYFTEKDIQLIESQID